MFSVKCQVVNNFSLCMPYSLCHNYSTVLFWCEGPCWEYVQKSVVLSLIKLYLQAQAAAWIWSMGCIFLTPGPECSVHSKKGTFSNFILDVCDIYETDFSQSLKFYFQYDFWWEEKPWPKIALTNSLCLLSSALMKL